jgi:hypothetical protein
MSEDLLVNWVGVILKGWYGEDALGGHYVSRVAGQSHLCDSYIEGCVGKS